MDDLKTMMCELIQCLSQELIDISKADTDEAGKVADIIKDLAMAQKYCWEAKYYESIVHAMEESDDISEMLEHTKASMESKHLHEMMVD